MDSVIFIVGLFSGIGVFLAAMYSLTQVLLLDGRGRIAHALSFLSVLAIMAALFFWASVPAARILAVPALAAGVWTFLIERRWYRVLPALVMLFALAILLGYVAV